MAGCPKLKYDFDKIYESNSCGPFKIIEDLGRDERSRAYVRIKFINTGTIKDVRYDIAMAGKVIDELYGIDFEKEYNSIYYGPFKIISYLGRDKDSKKWVRIKFVNTGYEYDTMLRQVKDGTVKDSTISHKDKLFSYSNEQDFQNIIIYILKGRWHSMMTRCYNKNSSSYQMYGEQGVTVCERWHDVNNYINDMPLIPNYDKFYKNPEKYQLDKDYLQSNVPKNKRVYSPETCIFLSYEDNANMAAKENCNKFVYHGISKTKNGNYKVEFSVNGKKQVFGIYSDLIAAVNEYNYYYSKYATYDLVPLFNECPFIISHEDAQKYYLVSAGKG